MKQLLKDILIQQIICEEISFREFADYYQSDEDVTLAACHVNGLCSIKPDELRDKIDIVTQAVKEEEVLIIASEKLRSDKDICFKNIRKEVLHFDMFQMNFNLIRK